MSGVTQSAAVQPNLNKYPRTNPGPFTISLSRNKNGNSPHHKSGKSQNPLPEGHIGSCGSASLVESQKVTVQTTTVQHRFTNPLKYSPKLGCHTLAFQSILRPHLHAGRTWYKAICGRKIPVYQGFQILKTTHTQHVGRCSYL